jgi:hypothetical protein
MSAMRRRIRLVVPVFALAALGLTSACQPRPPEGEAAATGDGLVFDDAIPADYDWAFTLHGGSGDLQFGDGDWAEGEHLFALSCLPRSRQVEMTWPGGGEAVLTAGTATGTFEHAGRAPTDHPVFAALKTSGVIAVGRSGSDLRLSAEREGRAALADFFAYCDDGREPRPPEPVREPATEPEEAETPEAETSSQAQPAPEPAEPTVAQPRAEAAKDDAAPVASDPA